MSPSVSPPGMPPSPQSQPLPATPARSRRKLAAAIATVAVLVGLVYLILGSPSNRLADPVAQAATRSFAAVGYRMRMSMEVRSFALPAPVTVFATGRFDGRDRAGSISLTMNLGNDPRVIQRLGSSTLHLEEILDAPSVYLKLPAGLAGTGGLLSKPWIKVDLFKMVGLPGLSSLQHGLGPTDPSQVLQYLRAASDSVVAEGRQRVDGFDTTHYRADLDLDHVATALPPAERARAAALLSTITQLLQVRTIPVDVWIGAARLVRRIEATVTATLPTGQSTEISIKVDIPHYGPEPPPAPPPAHEVQDISGLAGTNGASSGLAGTNGAAGTAG